MASLNIHPSRVEKGAMESAWMGADLAVQRINRLLMANDEAMVQVRMGNLQAVLKAKAIQEEIFDNIFFAFTIKDIEAITFRFNRLSKMINISNRCMQQNPKFAPSGISEMISILVTTNRILHIHLSRLKITFIFDEKFSYETKLAHALDVTDSANPTIKPTQEAVAMPEVVEPLGEDDSIEEDSDDIPDEDD